MWVIGDLCPRGLSLPEKTSYPQPVPTPLCATEGVIYTNKNAPFFTASQFQYFFDF